MSETPAPENVKRIVVADPWQSLKEFTEARIALGRTGSSLPLKRSLEFRMAHATAREAVYSELDVEGLVPQLESIGFSVMVLHSEVQGRSEYLQRPDRGRKLDEASRKLLAENSGSAYDVAFIIADGLSATAVSSHAVPLLDLVVEELKQRSLSIAPVTLVQQGRVAIGDEIGALLKSTISVMLIGERPGLTSTDSLGIYLTFEPQPGKTDESRNCISNVRPQGLSYEEAAAKLLYLIDESWRLKLSGVRLKDNSSGLSIG